MKEPETHGIMELMKEKDAAEYLGWSRSSLKQSRVTGKLAGVASPKYVKIGYSVRYKLSTLKEWLKQFDESPYKKGE